jgi:hypothetical protein
MTASERAAIKQIVDRLPGGQRARWRRTGVNLLCPAHDDRTHPNLDLDVKGERILAKCRAGCQQDALMAALYEHGVTAADLRVPNGQPPAQPKIEVTYDYHDERNEFQYQVVRYYPKDFRQRRPDRDHPGEWIWSMTGVRRLLYKLPELAEQTRIAWTEGEKDADALWAIGIPTTTTAGGVNGITPWLAEYVKQIVALATEEVCCFRDSDAPGESYRLTVARGLHEAGLRVTLVDLPPGPWKDVSDWLQAGGTREALVELIEAAPAWISAIPPASGAPAETEEPEPLLASRAPFMIVTPRASFITKYVEMAQQRTDAPPEAHELTAAGVLSALAGPRPRIRLAHAMNGVPLNIWTMNAAESTEARKSTTLDIGLEILTEVLGQQVILPWEGSPQAFIQKLAERDGSASVFARDEYSGLLAQINRGGHMAGLTQTFIRAFDGKPIENARTRKRVRKEDGEVTKVDDTDRANEPYLVKLCATTRTAFLEHATIDNVIDGFLARFIFTTGTAAPRRPSEWTEAIEQATQGVLVHARDFHNKASRVLRINLAPEILDLVWDLEKQYGAAARTSTRPDAAGPSMKRLTDAVLRVAALLAIDRSTDDGVTIIPADFEAAAAMGNRWKVTTLEILESLGRTRFLADCNAVMATVRARPDGIKLSTLYRAHRGIRKRDFDEILEALALQDRIKRETPATGRHRPPTVIYPWASAPKDLA